jgi:hypothetical protein
VDTLLVSEHTLNGLKTVKKECMDKLNIHTSTQDPQVIPCTRSSHFSDRGNGCRIEMWLASKPISDISYPLTLAQVVKEQYATYTDEFILGPKVGIVVDNCPLCQQCDFD